MPSRPRLLPTLSGRARWALDGRAAVVVGAAVASTYLCRRSSTHAALDTAEQDRAEREKAMIADLGCRALEVTDPVALMNEAVHAVRDVLEAVSCVVTRQMANGEVRAVAAAEDTHFIQAVAHVIGGALDRAATENELRRRALEDPLTGLANRALAISQLGTELRHARRMGHSVCVLVLDIDGFKALNDTLGHTVGDGLLRQVAARLSACVREEDLVARPGGDEFTIVCTRTASDHAIAEVAHRLVEVMAEPFEIGGRELFISASVGVTISEEGLGTPEQLLRDADAAMYHAKELGGGQFVAFDVELGQALGVHVLAEGIEGKPQLDALRELGCGFGQGFLFARPLPAKQAENLLLGNGDGSDDNAAPAPAAFQ